MITSPRRSDGAAGRKDGGEAGELTLTSRELVYRTLEFENTRWRVPRELWKLPWATERYPETMRQLQNEFVWDFDAPETVYLESSPVEKGSPYARGLYTDPWGCTFTNVGNGTIGEVKQPPIDPEDDEWEHLENVHFPEEWLSFNVDQVNRACREKKDKFLFGGCCPRPFEQLQFLRGSERLYMDLALRPEGMTAFIHKMHEFYVRLMEKWAQTDVDALNFMDDWGAQRGLLIRPQLWREIFKPLYKDYIDIAHAHGKKAFMHSDGYTLDILPDLIELGLDAINTQIFCMPMEELRPFRGKITFWGEICRQHLLPNGTVEDVRDAVASVYENLWADGGCIAQCEFGPGGRPENVLEVYRAWQRLRPGEE